MSIIRHRIEYSAHGVPLAQVIDSLKGQLRLLSEAVEVLQLVAPGSEIKITSVTVNEIKNGSLIVDLFLEIYGFYQTSIDNKVIGGVESLLGTDVPPEYETLVTLALIGVTVYVSQWIYDAVRKKKPEMPPPAHIQGNYNQVVTIIADKLIIPREAVDVAIGSVLHRSKVRQLVKPVADIIRPAKQQPGTKIEGFEAEITPEAIQEFPPDAELGQLARTEIVSLPDTLIDIRALDKDQSKRGWAARVIGRPDFTDKRLPMDLYPTVDASALAQQDKVRADLAVEMLQDAKGETYPRRLHLLAFREVSE